MMLAGPSQALGEAGGDFDPTNETWNGLSELVTLARAHDLPLEIPSRLDIRDLGPEDGLLIVHPSRELPLNGLAEFMRSGGRVALADDQGEGDTLLGLYRIERTSPDVSGAPLLRANEALPVAKVLYDHPLTRGISHLVTNHPGVVEHEALAPLIAFDGSREAVLLTGAVGAGRLVVLADPSVMINNMLELSDNRRFTLNLLEYLQGEEGGRVFLLTADATLVGSYGSGATSPPIARLREWLAELAHVDLPPAGLLLLAATLALLLLIFVVASVPRETPYRADVMLPAAGTPGGLEGRVRFFVERPAHLMLPARVLKMELEAKLRRLLSLDPQAPRQDIVAAFVASGAPADESAALRALLDELAQLRELDDAPGEAPKIRRTHLRRMVDTGERILDRLAPTQEAR